MQSNESRAVDTGSMNKITTSTHVVKASSIPAEQIPTIPIESLTTASKLQPEVLVHPISSTDALNIPSPLVQPVYQRSLRQWVQIWRDGLRPSYLTLSLLPVLIGSAVAWTQTITPKAIFGHFHLTHFTLTLVAVILLQLGGHLVNDYYDYIHRVDVGNAFGPGGLIQQGLLQPQRLLTAGLTALAAGVIAGLMLAVSGQTSSYFLSIVGLGLIGLLCAFFYSATTRSLSSLFLGELAAFFVFGPLPTLGAYLVQRGFIDRSVLIYGVLLGLFAVAIVHANNMRDVEGDAQAGRRTIATFIGLQWSRVFMMVLLICIYGIVLALALPHGAQHILLLTLWTLPLLAVMITGVLRTDAPAGLHLVMRQLLRLETYFVLLLIVALFITAFLSSLPPLPKFVLPI